MNNFYIKPAKGCYRMDIPEKDVPSNVYYISMEVIGMSDYPEKMPTQELLDSIEHLKEYKKKKNRKVYKTMDEIRETLE